MVIIKFKKLHKDAIIPDMPYTDIEAGIDFYCVKKTTIKPGETVSFPTGLSCEMETRFPDFKPALIIKDKSGVAIKKRLSVVGGVIDASYRGEIIIALYNRSKFEHIIRKGDKIAQGIIMLLPKIRIEEVEILSETKRGYKGFGSSNV